MWLPWIRFKAVLAGVFGSEMAEGIDLRRVEHTCTELNRLIGKQTEYLSISEHLEKFPLKILHAESPIERIQHAKELKLSMESGNARIIGIIIPTPEDKQIVDVNSQQKFDKLHEWIRVRYNSDIYWLKFNNNS